VHSDIATLDPLDARSKYAAPSAEPAHDPGAHHHDQSVSEAAVSISAAFPKPDLAQIASRGNHAEEKAGYDIARAKEEHRK
jgi:hypothetical protein